MVNQQNARRLVSWSCVVLSTLGAAWASAGEILPPISQRFASQDGDETPSFQKHVVPMMGRLGCNGRACHGSFQGKGGFRLSLFGYDFKADYLALTAEGNARIDLDSPLDSLIIAKPTSEDEHDGGKRYDVGSWNYHVIHRWIKAGAPFERKLEKLIELRVEPSEIRFDRKGQMIPLRTIAVWESGIEEDVTPLCRFSSNDSQIATIDKDGHVVSGETGDTHVVAAYDRAVVAVPTICPVTDKTGERYPKIVTNTVIDTLVVSKLRKLGVLPSDVCTDEEFLRRVSLDLTGTLPTPNEVREFYLDNSGDKRARKIEELLNSPAYAAWWTTKLCDFTGNNSDQTQNATYPRNASPQYWYDWIYRRVEKNVPYDELVAGIVLGKSRNDGESYTQYCQSMSKIYKAEDGASFADRETMSLYWARRDFRRAPERAISFAHSFLGVRIQCAQCHKHPFDQWSKNDFDEFSKFFSGVTASNKSAPDANKEYQAIMAKVATEGLRGGQLRKKFEEVMKKGGIIPFPEVYVSHRPRPENQNKNNSKKRKSSSRSTAPRTASLLGGEAMDLSQTADPRRPVMDWLRAADNPYFSKAFVNRVWASYFGIGIVDPPDDMSLANPPSNRPLLEHLATGFIDHKFDMKWVHREILNSDTYQRSWRPNDTNLHDRKNFSRAIPRRLPAEVVYDAIHQATGSDEYVDRWRAAVDERAIAIAGVGTRQKNGSSYALNVFGRSTRESSCDCDRSEMPNLLQTIYLQNDADVIRLIGRRNDGWLSQVAQQLGVSQNKEIPAKVRTQFERLEVSIERSRRNDSKEQLKRLTAKRRAMVERYGDPDASTKVAVKGEVDLRKIIEDAYLRTLSRIPQESELNRAMQYIDEGDDKVESFRGLVWALINTKEFVVNH